MEERKNVSSNTHNQNASNSVNSNEYKPLEDKALENEQHSIQDIPKSNQKNSKGQSAFVKRVKKSAVFFMTVAIVGMITYSMGHPSSSVNTTDQTEDALKTHMSTSLGVGSRLMSSDEKYVGGDLTITHKSNDDETTMYIWDYAAEDGDYVQVVIDGTPMGEPFMIKNKPISFKVPTVGEVQVIGTRDGGGGITYGVYYEANSTTYFNGMDVGGDNIYTLVRE
jgi:hypothetical protein